MMLSKDITENDVSELRECKLEEEFSNFFDSRGISDQDYKARSMYIKKATGEIAFYYSGDVCEMDPEELYLDDKALFFDGTWRLLLSKN